MSSITFYFFFIPLLVIILLAINLIFAPHSPYQEKNSVFECGFHSFLGQNRTQFTISFFIFALLFLLFDLEILLMYPFGVSEYENNIYGLIVMLIFFGALTLGFVFELGKKALKIDSKQSEVYVKSFNVLQSNLLVAAYISMTKFISKLFSKFWPIAIVAIFYSLFFRYLTALLGVVLLLPVIAFFSCVLVGIIRACQTESDTNPRQLLIGGSYAAAFSFIIVCLVGALGLPDTWSTLTDVIYTFIPSSAIVAYEYSKGISIPKLIKDLKGTSVRELIRELKRSDGFSIGKGFGKMHMTSEIVSIEKHRVAPKPGHSLAMNTPNWPGGRDILSTNWPGGRDILSSNPPVTNPPVTNPPVTNPPITNPPVTNPPVTNPPVTNSLVTNTPVPDSPVPDSPVPDSRVRGRIIRGSRTLASRDASPPVTDSHVTNPPVTSSNVKDRPGFKHPVPTAETFITRNVSLPEEHYIKVRDNLRDHEVNNLSNRRRFSEVEPDHEVRVRYLQTVKRKFPNGVYNGKVWTIEATPNNTSSMTPTSIRNSSQGVTKRPYVSARRT